MKQLEDRTEIARAINFKKYPVIRIDLSETDEYGIVGAPVVIDNGTFKTGEPFYVDATLRAYRDEGVLQFAAYGTCLHASFGYRDIEEMLKYANAPIVKANQDILVCMIDSKKRLAYNPVILRTGDHIAPFCSTPLKLERCNVPGMEVDK